MKKQHFDYIVCGGGASGLLFLKALTEDPFFNDATILLIEKETKNSNDRTWCFWEEEHGAFDSIVHKEWGTAQFFSKSLHLEFDLTPLRYKMLRSQPFYKTIYDRVKKTKNIKLLQTQILDLQSKGAVTQVITSEETYESTRVITSLYDHNALFQQKKYPVLQQHFMGWFIETPKACFDPTKILFMDFNIPQNQETRFLYVLPFDEKHALFEYTFFSEKVLDKKVYEKGIEDYLKKKGIDTFTLIEKEQGNIPMSCFPFEQANTPSLLHIGTAGGWTKASTGFTFLNTNRQVHRLIDFLKKGKPLNEFTAKNRFRFYDLLFLDVLSKYNSKGSELFERMFAKNDPLRIFRFLDEKTALWEDLLILASFSFQQKKWFIYALFRRFF